MIIIWHDDTNLIIWINTTLSVTIVNKKKENNRRFENLTIGLGFFLLSLTSGF